MRWYLASDGHDKAECLLWGLRVRVATLPDDYIDHAERDRQLAVCGLDVDTLYERATELCAPFLGIATKNS